MVLFFQQMALAAFTVVLPTLTSAADFYLEAAAQGRGRFSVLERSNARSGRTARLWADRDSVFFHFCLRQLTVVKILEVSYSNDGGSENVAVVIDSTFVGVFSTVSHSWWGQMWNVFLASPPLTRATELGPGQHSLRLSVMKPSDGVEIDSVHVWFSDARLPRDVLECLLYCLSTQPLVPPNEVIDAGVMHMRQASYPTKCAEEDNIKVPLYMQNVKEFTITATTPRYDKTTANRRDPDTSNCPFLPPDLWSFRDLTLKPASQTITHVSTNATLYILGGVTWNSWANFLGGQSQVLRIEFHLRGRSNGFVDADIGSLLTVRIDKPPGRVTMKIICRGRSQTVVTLPDVVFSPGQITQTLQFPDFTWMEYQNNFLQMSLQSYSPVHIHLSEIKLERRPMLGEKVSTVHASPQVVIESVDVDFWWREPQTMRLVNGDTGQEWDHTDFFRISLHVPWNKGFAQVFVMYQDGNIRLLPLPPPGLDWIPFGSSVLLGNSDPAQLRPAAPISTVIISPSSLVMRILFCDGGSVKLKLVTRFQQTVATVYDIIKVSDPANNGLYPFATLRSMYIEDGNSDCDSVLVDGTTYHPILDDWASVDGKSFFFFRRCESKHLTLSPDIRIDVTKSSKSDNASIKAGEKRVSDWSSSKRLQCAS